MEGTGPARANWGDIISRPVRVLLIAAPFAALIGSLALENGVGWMGMDAGGGFCGNPVYWGPWNWTCAPPSGAKLLASVLLWILYGTLIATPIEWSVRRGLSVLRKRAIRPLD